MPVYCSVHRLQALRARDRSHHGTRAQIQVSVFLKQSFSIALSKNVILSQPLHQISFAERSGPLLILKVESVKTPVMCRLCCVIAK